MLIIMSEYILRSVSGFFLHRRFTIYFAYMMIQFRFVRIIISVFSFYFMGNKMWPISMIAIFQMDNIQTLKQSSTELKLFILHYTY